MRVSSVNYDGVGYSRKNNYSKNRASVSPVSANSQVSGVSTISFAGKNIWQILSPTPENKGLGLPEAYLGGEGDVGYELPASLRKHEKIDGRPADVRAVMPFWEYNNSDGGYKFLRHEGVERSNLPDMIPEIQFISAKRGEDIQDVAKRLNIDVRDLDYVIQSKPDKGKSKYCILDPTSVSGSVKRPSVTNFGDIAEIPYRLFKVSADNPSYNKIKGEPHYFMYTPDLAASSQPYSYGPAGNVPFEAEIINSDAQRALLDIVVKDKMNTQEFDYYRPASIIAHDRPSSTLFNHIANLSKEGVKQADGIIIDKYEHNPGRTCQGVTNDPFKFFAVVATEKDLDELKKHPSYDVVRKAWEHGIDSGVLTDRERHIAKTVIEPFVAPFRDYAGTYNITKIPIVGVKVNPKNSVHTTVSWQYDKELASADTPSAAQYLTGDFASIPRKPNLNGVTPGNMRFDDNTAGFGRGGNGLDAHKTEFTTFKYNGDNIEEVIAARKKNAKWLTNLIWEASQKGQDELNKLLLNQTQISEGQNVWGALSPLKDDEILIFGFGRPVEQKGFPITARGYLNYLKDPNIPQEEKLRVKLLTGAGKWNEYDPDYKDLRACWEEVQTLDNGIYKYNWMNIDGFTPNRFVACSTHGMFTSRREMCGITPIQSKIAGEPYAATGTGGPVDYTNAKNGWLTPEPVELAPEKYGLTWANSASEIDNARVDRQAGYVSGLIHEMVDEYSNRYDDYVAKCKKNIEEKVDWHNNEEYNHGKSANKRLLEDILETDKGWDARSKDPLNRLVGKFGEYKAKAEDLSSYTKSKPAKFALFVAIGLLTVAGGAYAFVRNYKHNKAAKSPEEDKKTNDEMKAIETRISQNQRLRMAAPSSGTTNLLLQKFDRVA